MSEKIASSRKEAIQNGLKYYQLKTPCKHGHFAKRATKISVCFLCCRESGNKWYHKNRKKLPWRKDRIYKSTKNRANRKGIQFTIKFEEIVWNTHCPVLGIKLDYLHETGDRWKQVSLDRTDSSKGYIPGNVVVMSMRANSLKQDIKKEEVEKMYKYLKEIFRL